MGKRGWYIAHKALALHKHVLALITIGCRYSSSALRVREMGVRQGILLADHSWISKQRKAESTDTPVAKSKSASPTTMIVISQQVEMGNESSKPNEIT